MAEYISREELIKHLDKCRLDPLFDSDMARICFAIRIFVENMKAVDVQAVKHGQWTRIDDEYGHDYVCSVCNNKNDRKSHYCPDCGASCGYQDDLETAVKEWNRRTENDD